MGICGRNLCCCIIRADPRRGEERLDPQGGREEGILSLEEGSLLQREICLVIQGIGEELSDSREIIRISRARTSSSSSSSPSSSSLIKTARSADSYLLIKKELIIADVICVDVKRLYSS